MKTIKMLAPTMSLFRLLISLLLSLAVARTSVSAPRFELVPQIGASGSQTALAYSPDGRFLASSDENSTRLWEARSSELRRVFRGGGPLAFSPDGKLLAVGGSGVRIWNVENGQLQRFLNAGGGGVAFSGEGRSLLTGAGHSFEGGGLIFDTRTWATKRRLTGGESYWFGYAKGVLSPDGRIAVTVNGSDYDDHNKVRARLWDVATGKSVATFKSSRGVRSLAYSPRGDWVALGQENNTLALWNPQTQAVRSLLNGPSGQGAIWPIYAVQFSPDGTLLFSTSDDGTTKVWDVASGKLQKSVPLAPGGDNYLLAVSPNGHNFASRGRSAPVIGDMQGNVLLALAAPPPSLGNLVFSPDGQALAFSTGDSMAHVWNWKAPSQRYAHPVLGRVAGLAYGKDGKSLRAALARREDDQELGQIWQWNAANGLLAEAKKLPAAPWTLSPDGTLTATFGLYSKGVQLSDARTGKNIRSLILANQLMSFAFASASTAASAERNETIRLWNLSNGQNRIIHVSDRHNNDFQARVLAVSPRASLVAGAEGGAIRIWDAAMPRERQLPPLKQDISQLRFSQDEQWLAAGDAGGGVTLWKMSQSSAGKPAREQMRRFHLGNHDGPVASMAFAPDGRVLATASADGSLKIWDLPSRTLRLTLHFFADQTGSGWLAMGPQGNVLASKSAARWARWRPAGGASGEALLTLDDLPTDALPKP